jgi:hypothetical protein
MRYYFIHLIVYKTMKKRNLKHLTAIVLASSLARPRKLVTSLFAKHQASHPSFS